MIKNDTKKFGLISKLFHWLSAITVLGLFAAGYWMVDLDYYSQWYKTAPHWHKSIGCLLLLFTLARLLWKLYSPPPQPIEGQSAILNRVSKTMHTLLYIVMIIIMISGYLISTADGRPIEVFNWFSIASLGELITNQEDIAGVIHEYLAYFLIFIVIIHAVAALKHHFIDRDDTLKRML